MIIDEKYQGHAKALTKSSLASKIFPTLKQIWKKSDALKLNNDAKRENKSGGQGRSTYFYIVLSNIWKEKIYNIVLKTSWLQHNYLVTYANVLP